MQQNNGEDYSKYGFLSSSLVVFVYLQLVVLGNRQLAQTLKVNMAWYAVYQPLFPCLHTESSYCS